MESLPGRRKDVDGGRRRNLCFQCLRYLEDGRGDGHHGERINRGLPQGRGGAGRDSGARR